MAMDRKELIELYKTTLEEARHHDTINMQIFVALGVVISLFLAAIGLFFAKDFPLRYVCCAKAGILVLFLAVEVFFYSAFYRINKKFKACDEVREKIETELLKGTPELNSLLIGLELSKMDDNNCYARHRFTIYIVAGLVALITLGLLLFVFIRP